MKITKGMYEKRPCIKTIEEKTRNVPRPRRLISNPTKILGHVKI